MIVLGIILILVGYLPPVPAVIATIGWTVLVIGIGLLILGQVGRPVGGRRARRTARQSTGWDPRYL